MRFTWPCFVIEHASGRVTAHPLGNPAVFAHATSTERALEDLQLALDDRVSRAHPGRLGELARGPAGRLETLEVEALAVWAPGGPQREPLALQVLVAPAQRPFVEVYAPRLDLRLWISQETPWQERAAELLRAHLERLPDERLADLRPEARESVAEVSIDAKPTLLSSLRYAELTMPERPPPQKGGPTEDPAESDLEAEYDEEVTGRRRRKAGTAARVGEKVRTPRLDALAIALHRLAQRGRLERAYERDELVERLATRVQRDKPEALLLVGPAGAGKSALLYELVHRMTRADAPEPQRERPHFAIEATRLIAGEGFFGQWQRQLLEVLDEARASRAVLHLGHVIELLDAGKSAHSDANVSQLLGPALAARELCAVGEATPEEWARIERRNASFARVFSVVRIDEPTPEQAARIVERVAQALAARNGLTIDPSAVSSALALSRRFRPYGALVGNAVTFVRRLADARAHAGVATVSALDAIRLFSNESGIPELLLRDDVPLEPERVRDFLRARVMGQEGAVDRVTEVVSVIKAALPDQRKPVAVLFFAGPTGVGKTDLSKALAEFLFGSRDRLVRLDMGEYAGPDALARLVGSYGEPGHLAAAVRRQPFSVVLLDEIEKAHPAVFDALLGVLGEGRLTDSDGRFTDFRTAVIVMTSNLGADTLRARVGFGAPSGAAGPGERDAAAQRELRAHYVGEAERFFRPELFNRIDDFVVFSPLPGAVVRAIVAREVERVRDREGMRRHDVHLEVSDAALDALAARGMDPKYGARPLKRAIERELVAPIATYLSSHPAQNGLRFAIDAAPEDGALTFKPSTVSDTAGGVLRRSALEMLDAASELRAHVQRWEHSALVQSLRAAVRYTDRASRLPGFFDDRSIADAALRRAATGRELLDRLSALRAQVDAAEELAMEAWFTRSDARAIAPLRGEVDQARAALHALRIDLYATLYPNSTAVTMFFRVARGGRACIDWLVRVYEKWASARGLATTLQFTTVKRPPGEHADAKPVHDQESVLPLLEWHRGPYDAHEVAHPYAFALEVRGGAAALLLMGEQGGHRFYETGSTHLVHVWVEPRGGATAQVRPSDLALRPSLGEIRRVQPAKKLVHDHRYSDDYDIEDEVFDCAPLCERWLEHRALAREVEAWS